MDGSVLGDLLGGGLLLLFQLCGLCVARLLLPRESGGVRLLLGSVLGMLMMMWLPALFAFLLGFTVSAHVCALLLGLCIAGACLLRCKKKSVPGYFQAATAFLRHGFLWVVLAMCGFFVFLIHHSFLFKNGVIYSSQATFGDMSMHLSFITSIARQGQFPPTYSLLPGYRLSYPFLGDSISSSLYLCGMSLKLSYLLPMALAGAQVFFGFYLFAARLLGSWKKGALAWVLFFLNGGLGFVYFLTGEKSLSDLLTGFYQTPTNLVEKNIRWVNVVVDMMLPQRATLFGWAVLFPTLYLLYRAVYQGEKRYFPFVGVLAGLLPMVHTHSFVVLAMICGGWLFSELLGRLSLGRRAALAGKILVLLGLPAMSLLRATVGRLSDQGFLLWFVCGAAVLFLVLLGRLLWKAVKRFGRRELLGTWGVLLLVTCALALPQLCYWTFRQVGENSMVRGHFGWIICQNDEGYLWFYLKNIGLTALLALGGLFTAKTKSFGKYCPALLIWFLAEFVEFQPNDYDNNKLLYPAFALLCCCAAEFIFQAFHWWKERGPKGGFQRILRVAAAGAGLAVCVCSAVLTMARESVAQYELFGEGAIALSRYVEEETEPGSVFLTDTRHNNEIASLSGRNIVCGSPAFLYYHGLPYGENEQAARWMFEEPERSENLYREFGVDYILISDYERSSYQIDVEAIERLFPKVYEDGSYALYRVEFDTE